MHCIKLTGISSSEDDEDFNLKYKESCKWFGKTISWCRHPFITKKELCPQRGLHTENGEGGGCDKTWCAVPVDSNTDNEHEEND